MSENKRKICCYCERWESGGIEAFLCNVLSRTDPERLEIDIVTAEQRPSVFAEQLRQHGIHFYELSGSSRRLRANHRAFRELLRARRYDVLHLQAFQGLTLAYLRIAKQAGVPVRIAHSHGTALRKSFTRPLKLLLHRFGRARYTRDATDLWACSRQAAEFLFAPRELQRRGYRWIPDGIDLGRFRFDPAARARVRAELGVADAFVLGHVGRLCEEKNQLFLLDVFAALCQMRPRSRLLLVGEGEYRAILEEKAVDLEIADRVIFYGSAQKVEELLWAMDVFAFPSKFEGFGIALLEAQAAGLPVVCSEHVPPEAARGGRVSRISLAESALVWARRLLEVGDTGRARADAADLSAFEIERVAERVQRYYLETCWETS